MVEMNLKEKLTEIMEMNIAGIPGKYLIAGIIVILVLAGVYVVSSGGGPSTVPVKIAVKSNGKYLEGASISIYQNGELVKTISSGKGLSTVELPSGELKFVVSKSGCEKLERTVSVSPGSLITLPLECGAPEVAGKECISFAKSLDYVKIYVDNKPGKHCQVVPIDENGNILDLGWKVKYGYKVIFNYDEKNCPTALYKVKINCDKATATMDMLKFLSDAKMFGKIKLVSNTEETKESKENTNLADKTYNVYVSVKDDKGNTLSGIKVSAVDKAGFELNMDYSNVQLSGTTSFDGRTRLVLPAGQTFYLKAEDPEGNHPPTGIEGPYTANQELDLEMTMKTGFTSTIRVKNNETGEPLIGAGVAIYSGNTLVANGITGEDGTASFSLEKKDYKVVVAKSLFLQKTEKITGGQDLEISLDPLNDKNSANVKVKVTNAHGFNEPMEGIDVVIKDKSGVALYEGKTDSNGEIDFGRIAAGSYVAYVPAMDNQLESDFSQPFQVVPGKDQTVTLSIVPPQVKLSIETDVEGYPVAGVHVQIFDVKYNPLYPNLVWEGDSQPPGKIEVSLDKGSVIYMKASFVDPNGRMFGPILTQKMTINNDTTMKIDLSKTTFNQTAYLLLGNYNGCRPPISPIKIMTRAATQSIGDICLFSAGSGNNMPKTYVGEPGEEGYIILPVNLPYYDPQTKEIFDAVSVEVFTGTVGSLEDIKETPIIIKDFNALDLMRGSQDIKGIRVEKSNYMTWMGPSEPVPDTQMHTAKYVRVTFSNYKGNMTYLLKIPIKIRYGANGMTRIYYRTTWIKGETNYTSEPKGSWDFIDIMVTNKGQWTYIDNPTFYAYRAWLSADETGKTKIDKLSDGSQFYLQVELDTKQDVDNWQLNWSILPKDSGIKPISYTGYILSGNGTMKKIYETELNGNSVTGGNLKAEDIVHLAVKFTVDTNPNMSQSITDKIEGEFDILGDREHPVTFTVIPAPEWERTNIPNILYKAGIYSLFESQNEWVKQGNFISTYSWKENTPRKFAMTYIFKNNGNEPRNVRLVVKDAGLDKNDPKALFYKQITMYTGKSGQEDEFQLPPVIKTGHSSIRLIGTGSPVEKLDFNFTIEPNNATIVIIPGVGTPKLAYESSKIQVFLGLVGENEVPKWKEYEHGTLDYAFNVTDADTGKKPNLGTNILKIQVLREIYKNGQLMKEVVRPAWFEADNMAGRVKLGGSALGSNTVYGSFQDAWDYVLADVSGKIVPGTLELSTYSPIFGDLTENITIGGLVFDPQGIQHYVWNSTYLYINNLENETTVDIINQAGENVSISFKWWPTAPGGYNVGIYYDTLNAYGVDLGNTTEIPANGTMTVTIKGGANGNCAGESTYTLEIRGTNESGELVGANYYKFTFHCVGGQAQMNITGLYPVREETPVDQISTESCGIEGQAAKVCDADQFVKFLVEAAKSVRESGAVGQVKEFQANLGIEELSAQDMNTIAGMLGEDVHVVKEGHQTSSMDIILPGYFDKVTCGIIDIKMSLTHQGDVQTSIDVNSSVPWCNESRPQYIIGLMNLDEVSRTRERGISFVGDSKELEAFVNATLEAMGSMDIIPENLFGYAGTEAGDIVNKFTSTGGKAKFEYYETDQIPANIECTKEGNLGNGFRYCLRIGGIEAPDILLYLEYPADLNLSNASDLEELNEKRVEMARDLIGYWFQKVQGGGPVVNAKPVIDSIEIDPETPKPDQTINITIKAHDKDSEILHYHIIVHWYQQDTNVLDTQKDTYGNTITEQAQVKGPGEYIVTVTVSDDQGKSNTTSLQFSVENVENVPPKVKQIEANPSEMIEGEQKDVEITARVRDDDSGSLTYSIRLEHDNMAKILVENQQVNLIDNHEATIDYTISSDNFSSIDTYRIYITVSDGNATVSNGTYVIVSSGAEPNHKPEIEYLRANVTKFSKPKDVNITANIRDEDDSKVKYKLVLSNTDSRLNSRTLVEEEVYLGNDKEEEISYIIPRYYFPIPGTYEVILSVSDDQDYTSKYINIKYIHECQRDSDCSCPSPTAQIVCIPRCVSGVCKCDCNITPPNPPICSDILVNAGGGTICIQSSSSMGMGFRNCAGTPPSCGDGYELKCKANGMWACMPKEEEGNPGFNPGYGGGNPGIHHE